MQSEPHSDSTNNEYAIFDILVSALKYTRRETNRRYKLAAEADTLHRHRTSRDIANRMRGDFEACLKQYTANAAGIDICYSGNTFYVTINQSALAYIRKLKRPDQKFPIPKMIRKVVVIQGQKISQEPLPGIDQEEETNTSDTHIYVLGYTAEAGLIGKFYVRDQTSGVQVEYHELSTEEELIEFPTEIEAVEPNVPEPKIVRKGKAKGDSKVVGE